MVTSAEAGEALSMDVQSGLTCPAHCERRTTSPQFTPRADQDRGQTECPLCLRLLPKPELGKQQWEQLLSQSALLLRWLGPTRGAVSCMQLKLC